MRLKQRSNGLTVINSALCHHLNHNRGQTQSTRALYGCLPVRLWVIMQRWSLNSKGLDARQAASFALKKYRSHRRVGLPTDILAALYAETASRGLLWIMFTICLLAYLPSYPSIPKFLATCFKFRRKFFQPLDFQNSNEVASMYNSKDWICATIWYKAVKFRGLDTSSSSG